MSWLDLIGSLSIRLDRLTLLRSAADGLLIAEHGCGEFYYTAHSSAIKIYFLRLNAVLFNF